MVRCVWGRFSLASLNAPSASPLLDIAIKSMMRMLSLTLKSKPAKHYKLAEGNKRTFRKKKINYSPLVRISRMVPTFTKYRH